MTIRTIIEKEQISDYQFTKAPIDQTTHYRMVLKYFERLGNEFKGKCSITFNTHQGERTVVTTIWSVTDDYCQLKGGISIPLSSIIEVTL